MSHMGRPEGKRKLKFSLQNIINSLENLVGKKIIFCSDCTSTKTLNTCIKSKPGDIILLENLRFHKEEQSGDLEFAKVLSKLGDVYVNDAFGTAHRNHASTSTITKFFKQKCIGNLIKIELENINKILKSHLRPFTAILGGSKVSDKIKLIEKLMKHVDNIIIGGAMSNTFIKAMGGNIGNSIFETDQINIAKNLIKRSMKIDVNISLPVDCLASKAIEKNSKIVIYDSYQIKDKWINLDIGPHSINKLNDIIKKSKKILWNGPLGFYEIEQFSKGTNSIAKAIASSTKKGAYSLVGGGDSIAALNNQKLIKSMSFVSTGGGALLNYITEENLLAINSIKL